MAILLIILFGALQGLTEFLPVSSSGHLTLFEFFTNNFKGSLTLNIAVHVGTLMSVLIYYRHDIISIISGLLRNEKESRSQTIYIIIALAPTIVLGLLMKIFFNQYLTNPLISSICLLITGLILFSTTKLKSAKYRTSAFGMTPTIALMIGLVQGIAVLPGLSRSGLTIVAALWLGVDRKNAARFSFLISVPAIIGAALLEFIGESEKIDGMQMGLGMAVSFAVGLFAISWMVKLTENLRLSNFSYYVWLIGLISLGLQLY